MVKLLLENNADGNAANSILGRTPLHYAVEQGHKQCVEILLDYGADPYALDNQTKSSL